MVWNRYQFKLRRLTIYTKLSDHDSNRVILSPCLSGNFKLRIQMVASNICNYNCLYCHREGNFNKHCSNKNISPGVIKSLFEAAKPFGCWGLSLTGGEPLMNTDLDIYLQTLSGSGVISVTTNASLLSWEIISMLKHYQVNEIYVHLPSINPNIYSQLTGQHKISVFQIIESISCAQQAGLNVRINSVICNGYNNSYDEITALYEFSVHNKIEGLNLIELVKNKSNPFTIQHHLTANEIIKNSGLPIHYEGVRPNGLRYRSTDNITVDILTCGQCSTICAECQSSASLFITNYGSLKPCMWTEKGEFLIDMENPRTAITKALTALKNGLTY